MRNKKKFLVSSLILSVTIGIFVGCGKKEISDLKFDEEEIRNLSELATLECYYHNVAKSTKEGDWQKKERKFWIEYTGVAKIGVDMTQIELKTEGNTVYVSMPDAHVLELAPDETSITEDSFIASQDGWWLWAKNEITAENQRDAVAKAENEARTYLEGNKSLMGEAKARAEELIENYILEFAEASGYECEVVFVDIDDESSTTSENTSTENDSENVE